MEYRLTTNSNGMEWDEAVARFFLYQKILFILLGYCVKLRGGSIISIKSCKVRKKVIGTLYLVGVEFTFSSTNCDFRFKWFFSINELEKR